MTPDEVTAALRRGLGGERLSVGDLIDLRIAVRVMPVVEVHNALTAAIEAEAAVQFGEAIP